MYSQLDKQNLLRKPVKLPRKTDSCETDESSAPDRFPETDLHAKTDFLAKTELPENNP